jgi:hypothetical protein
MREDQYETRTRGHEERMREDRRVILAKLKAREEQSRKAKGPYARIEEQRRARERGEAVSE